MIIDILMWCGLALGISIGLFIGHKMATDVIADWSDFAQFLGGICCYVIWGAVCGAIGFASGVVAVPIVIILGPVYLAHRHYFSREKVRY